MASVVLTNEAKQLEKENHARAHRERMAMEAHLNMWGGNPVPKKRKERSKPNHHPPNEAQQMHEAKVISMLQLEKDKHARAQREKNERIAVKSYLIGKEQKEKPKPPHHDHSHEPHTHPKDRPKPHHHPQKTQSKYKNHTTSKVWNDLKMNQIVKVGGLGFGTIKFIGCVHYAQGMFVGVDLHRPNGEHDGYIHGRRYFTAMMKSEFQVL